MTNSKKIFKIRMFDLWQIGECESWLSDMAKEGLILDKIGLFARFIQSEPQDIQYRIDVSFEQELSDEDKEIYENTGWDYVTTYGKFNVFSSPKSRNAEEIHTDLQEQSYTLKGLDKMYKMNLIFLLLFIIFIIASNFYPIIMSETPVLDLVDNRYGSFIPLIIFELFILYNSMSSFISIRKLRKNLVEGKAINHKANWRRSRLLKSMYLSIFAILLFIMIALPFFHAFSSGI